MDKEEKAKKLGFANYDEMLLYEDICAGRDVKIPNFPEEIKFEEVLKTNYHATKQDYDVYIKNNGLLELFNKVKLMPLFNRMVEIYVYYANIASLCNLNQKLYKQKHEEAKELFDGEKELETRKLINKYFLLEGKCLSATIYIQNQVKIRMPNETSKFYDSINNVLKVLFESKGDSDSTKKM